MGKFSKNYDRFLQKAHTNIPLYNSTANTNALPAKGKTQVFPPWELWVVKFPCKE